jgi:hypothetical protein
MRRAAAPFFFFYWFLFWFALVWFALPQCENWTQRETLDSVSLMAATV